jgi:ABC-type transport system involved in cytochrome c biogenesis permease subunit
MKLLISPRALLVSLALFALAAPGLARSSYDVVETTAPALRVDPYPEQVIEDFSLLPIMNSGRIKPMRTFAGYTMLAIRGIRKMSWTHTLPGGETRKETIYPVTFVLDALFFPEQAQHYPAILVTDSDVLDAIGLGNLAKKKRDRYSFAQLSPGFGKLEEIVDRILNDPGKQKSQDRTRIENQLVDLRMRAHRMAQILGGASFGNRRYELSEGGEISKFFGGAKEIGYVDVLARRGELSTWFDRLSKESENGGSTGTNGANSAPKNEVTLAELRTILTHFNEHSARATRLMIFPGFQSSEEDPTWWSAKDVASFAAQKGTPPSPEHGKMLAHFAGMSAHRDEPARFGEELSGMLTASRELAERRGEYRKIPLEVSYINADYFYYSKLGFVFAFLFVAFSWLFTRTRWLWWAAHIFTTAAAAYATYGIVIRCILRERPPVSTLYETILFITTTCVLLALFMEWVSRRRLALPVGASLGAIGMFIAGRYEIGTAEDTMPQLIAVLDTNFWLATHVTTITIGYAAGLIAGAVGHVFVIGKLFKAWRNRPDIYKNLGRMIYGLLAFGLVFSVVGTILGGIWANDSWGRFWGWDPKENGALLICIYMVATLHARLGGYVRNFGMAICAVLGSAVVAFSWWGVNMLGVGLHSYGFTEGAFWVQAFYVAEYVVGVLGIYALMRDKNDAKTALALERARKEGEQRAREELEKGGALQS